MSEKINFSPEQKHEIEDIEGTMLREKLHEQRERAGEKSSAEDLENKARLEIEKLTAEREQTPVEHERVASPAERRTGATSKSERDASFKTTMNEVHAQLSAPSRAFSKLIHNQTIEKISDVAANTVARPNAILSGAVFAFVLTLGVYLVAKNLGYPLSGFETIGAFALGWTLGTLYDFLKVMVTGRSS